MKTQIKTKNNILLGVTGCISCYKAAYLVRLLVKEGFDVKVILTESAQKFVTPLTFKCLSKNKVYTQLFSEDDEWDVEHVSLASWSDVMIVAPASANTISKIAYGIADNLFLTTLLAFDKKIIIAPSMNDKMWANEMISKNIKILKENPRFLFVDPEAGELACGVIGNGRLAKLENIIKAVKKVLNV